MTERDWLTSADPDAMLAALPAPATPRKLLLFACACLRRVEARFPPAGAVREVLERKADGGAVESPARRSFTRALNGLTGREPLVPAVLSLMNLDANPAGLVRIAVQTARAFEAMAHVAPARRASPAALTVRAAYAAGHPDCLHAQADLLREVLGNPFAPVAVNPDWLTPAVLDLAKLVDRDQAFDKLPILADALEDAGCDAESLLAHLRADAPHARGCWAVDAILGRG